MVAPLDLVDATQAVQRLSAEMGDPAARPGDSLGPPPAYLLKRPMERLALAPNIEVHEIEAALMAIRPERLQDYGTWHDVGAALAYCELMATEGAAFRDLFHSASSRPGATRPGKRYCFAETERLFDEKLTATRERLARGDPIRREGTIYRMALEDGWGRSPATPAASAWAFDRPESSPAALPSLASRDIATCGPTAYKRRPVLGDLIFRRELHNCSSAGGLGKSTWTTMLAVSVATGRDLLGYPVHHPLKVMMINGEDSRGEVTMRLHAACMHHRIQVSQVAGRLFSFGAEDADHFRLVEADQRSRQAVINHRALEGLAGYVREAGIGLVILDPLVSFFPADMNANGAVASAMLALKRLATQTDCALLIVQHVAKGTSADTHGADSASGAASTVNLARSAFGIVGVSASDGPKLGIAPGEERDYFRLVNTKANLAARADDGLFRRVAVPMGNGTTEFPDQDWVPVAVPFTPSAVGIQYPPAVLRAAVSVLATGLSGTLPFSPSPGRSSRPFKADVAQVLAPHYPGLKPQRLELVARQVVDHLAHRGWTIEESIRVPKLSGGGGSTSGKGLFVRWSHTPWASEAPPGNFVK